MQNKETQSINLSTVIETLLVNLPTRNPFQPGQHKVD